MIRVASKPFIRGISMSSDSRFILSNDDHIAIEASAERACDHLRLRLPLTPSVSSCFRLAGVTFLIISYKRHNLKANPCRFEAHECTAATDKNALTSEWQTIQCSWY
jgi:hypothetical protein